MNFLKHPMRMLALAGLSLLLVSGCKKDKDEAVDTDTTAAAEFAAMDAAFDDVSGISDEAAEGSLQSYRSAGDLRIATSCAIITYDSISVPRRITVDFGTTNCTCLDGNTRRGKILIDFTGAYRDSGSTHTISFDNYFVNDNQLTGTKTVTNSGHNAAGNLSYSVQVNGSVYWSSAYGGGVSSVNSSRTREWVQGANTLIWSDDIYRISGSASGVTRSGLNYTIQITTPLKKEIGWRYFTEGILVFTPGTRAPRTIDYSFQNGARDNKATVTINGVSFNITL